MELCHDMVIMGTGAVRRAERSCSPQRLVRQCSKVRATGLGERNSLGAETAASLEHRIVILSSVLVLSLFVTPKSTPKFCFKHIDA